MLCAESLRAVILCLSILFISNWTTGQQSAEQPSWLQSAQAASDQTPTQSSASKTISQKALEKYKSISVTVEEDGKEVKYSGVPLRAMLAEMVPKIDIDVMPEWKTLSRQELVMEVMGDDGYPGLVTATELAINRAGDRYVLATQRDDKLIESGVRLICKMDEAHVRWIKQVVSLRLVPVSK